MTAEVTLVRDLMTVGVKTCPLNTPLVEVARLLLDERLDAVAVMDPEGHAVGVVSQDDLVRSYAREADQDLTAEQVMQEGVPQLPPDIPLAAAAQIMRDLGVRTVFLMHHAGGIAYPAATLSYWHLLRHLAAEDNTTLDDLGVKAQRQAPLETFIAKRDAARAAAEGRAATAAEE